MLHTLDKLGYFRDILLSLSFCVVQKSLPEEWPLGVFVVMLSSSW